MNIFILSNDLEESARYHVDKHVVKMITEQAQILSAVLRKSGVEAGYRLTHKNHPCVKWTEESLANWLWLKEFTYRLGEEYTYRYGKVHKSISVVDELPDPPIQDVGMTPFALAVPDDCLLSDAVQSYRQYYAKHKQHIAKWKNRPTPDFMIKNE